MQAFSYQDSLDFLYQQLPMFQKIGKKAFKKDLTNIKALCEQLGNPHSQFRSVHIAGTNGKGSTAHLLAATLQAQGLKVGVYTSPHYKDFRERIKINGTLIPKQAVTAFVQKIKPILSTLSASFFEITVAMAFDYFATQKVDVAIIETGLGGRLDSTNIISPLLSIITNISYDHQSYLGNTLPLIATEKAGIIKLDTPVVIGETQPEVVEVFTSIAAQRNAPISFADQHYQIQWKSSDLSHSYFEVKYQNEVKYSKLKVNLHGRFQTKNVTTLFQSLDKLSAHFSLSEDQTLSGLEDLKALTYFIGRWQIKAKQPLTILDSAHNEAGIGLVMEQLQTLAFQQLHFIFGAVKDKPLEKVLPQLPKSGIYYFAKADIPRGLDAQLLQERAAEYGLKGRAYSSVRNALRAAKRKAHPEDLIFVGGSIFVVAEVV